MMKEDLIVYVICNVILTGIVVFLLQQFVLYKVNKKLTEYGKKLDAIKSKDVVRYEKLLGEALPRIEKLNSLLHEERVICNEALIRGFRVVFHNNQEMEDKYEDTARNLKKKQDEIIQYLVSSSHFLPDDLVKSYNNLCNSLASVLGYIELYKRCDDPDSITKNQEKLIKDIHEKTLDLYGRLKKILGVDLNDPGIVI